MRMFNRGLLCLLLLSLMLPLSMMGAQEATETAAPGAEATAEATMAGSAGYQDTQTGMHAGGQLGDTADPAVSSGFVRFAHTAADVGAVDIFIEGFDTPAVTNLQYGEFTDFFTVPSGSHTFTARTAGMGTEAMATAEAGAGEGMDDVVASLTWDISEDTSWLISLVGLNSNVSVSLEPVSILRGDLTDTARVRVINYISGADPVTVSGQDGTDFGSNLGWIGVFDIEDVQSGTQTLNLAIGEENVGESTSVNFDPNMHYLLLAIGGAEGNPSPELLVIPSERDAARVQFVNNSDQPVNLFMRPGDNSVVEGLEPGATSDWLTFPSGDTTFYATGAGSDASGQELGAWIDRTRPGRDVTITFNADGSFSASDPVWSESDMEMNAVG